MARCNSLIRFIDFTVFCGAVEATDSTIISRHTSTVPCSGTRPLSPPRGTSITTCACWLKPVRRLLPHHNQHIAALQADQLLGEAKAGAVHHVRRQADAAQ